MNNWHAGEILIFHTSQHPHSIKLFVCEYILGRSDIKLTCHCSTSSPPSITIFLNSSSCSFSFSSFYLSWDLEKGKRRLNMIWNVLTLVFLRKLNWLLVKSPYSQLSDPLHLVLISEASAWALMCHRASLFPLTSVSLEFLHITIRAALLREYTTLLFQSW